MSKPVDAGIGFRPLEIAATSRLDQLDLVFEQFIRGLEFYTNEEITSCLINFDKQYGELIGAKFPEDRIPTVYLTRIRGQICEDSFNYICQEYYRIEVSRRNEVILRDQETKSRIHRLQNSFPMRGLRFFYYLCRNPETRSEVECCINDYKRDVRKMVEIDKFNSRQICFKISWDAIRTIAPITWAGFKRTVISVLPFAERIQEFIGRLRL